MSSEGDIINYEAPGAWRQRPTQRYFWFGAIWGEVISAALMPIVMSAESAFPLIVAYPHLFLLTEAFDPFPSSAPAWVKVAVSLSLWFVLGPGLFAAYGLLLSLRRRWLWATLAGIVHVLLFLWVCYLRDVFHRL